MFNDLFSPQAGGMTTQALDPMQAEELLKTMQIGHAYGGAAPTSLVGGGALSMESIDGTLKSVTYDASNLVFWPSIPQDRAYSLVEQFVRTNSYGDTGTPFIPETGSPVMNDATYDRHAAKVVFMSTRRGVSLASTLVKMQFGADAESREAQAGTLWMLERLERELYKGLADFSNGGVFDGSLSAMPIKLQNLNLLGLEAQIRQGDQDYTAQIAAFQGFGGQLSVISDSAGQTLAESDFEDKANIMLENFAHPSEVHLQPKDMSNFVKQFYPKERVNLGMVGLQDGKAGYVVRSFMTTAGEIALKPNVFLKPKDVQKSANDRAGVPAAPASVTAAELAADSIGSNLQINDTYAYAVAACNEQGEGAAVATVTKSALSANGVSVRLTIAQPASGNTPTHYAVYRTGNTATGTKKFVGYVARTGANTLFTDRGYKVPGSSTAYMMDMDASVLVWKQLAPLMRINLAQVTTAKEFLLWLAGTMIVFAPRKLGIFQNIGF